MNKDQAYDAALRGLLQMPLAGNLVCLCRSRSALLSSHPGRPEAEIAHTITRVF